MSVTLGGITLSPHLVLEGLDTAPLQQVRSKRTLGQRLVVQKRAVAGGRSLALQGEGHFTLAQINQIKALEAAGAAVALVHPRFTGQVLITGTPVAPMQQRSNPGDDAWYSGTIDMIEV